MTPRPSSKHVYFSALARGRPSVSRARYGPRRTVSPLSVSTSSMLGVTVGS